MDVDVTEALKVLLELLSQRDNGRFDTLTPPSPGLSTSLLCSQNVCESYSSKGPELLNITTLK